MSPIKEPNYFNTDAGVVGRLTKAQYERLFDGANEKHQQIGEATTGYLRSSDAVPRILAYADDPKFIICVRNPIEMALSLHSERLKEGFETEPSFATAWHLQEDRKQGKRVPRLCLRKEALLYGSICSLGQQVERVYEIAGPHRVLVVILDDLKSDPEREFRRVLKFLALPDERRSRFPVENEALYLPPLVAGALRVGALAKKRLGIRKSTRAITVTRRLLGQQAVKPHVSPELMTELKEYFHKDVLKLSACLARDLMYWLDVVY